jgi:transcriptional regulator with XRE-family HTH domain
VVVKSAPEDCSRVRKVSGAASYLAALGQAVRRHRERLGLSQEKYAFEVELDRTYVSGIERGVRNPTVATLLRLTGILGIAPSALLKAAERKQK